MVIIFQAVHKYIKNKALNGCKCFISFPLQYIEFERISIVRDAEIVGSIEVIYQFWKFPWPLICFTINSIFFKSFCVYVLLFFASIYHSQLNVTPFQNDRHIHCDIDFFYYILILSMFHPFSLRFGFYLFLFSVLFVLDYSHFHNIILLNS